MSLKIYSSVLSKMSFCCLNSDPDETGGILLGYYSNNYTCATVIDVEGAPEDSKSGSNWFIRGVNGLMEKLSYFWKKNRTYYLGEWHYHPSIFINISSTDKQQILDNAIFNGYNCPEPICIIMGRSQKGNINIKAFLAKNNKIEQMI